MKKILFVATWLFASVVVFAQDAKKKEKVDLSDRANDHLMFQFGIAGWNGVPDSINTNGFSSTVNGYFLFDFPLKSSPNFSVGIGAGIGSDRIKLKNTQAYIKDINPTLRFQNVEDTNHFKKGKLVNTYLEAPIELRYTHNPSSPNKSFKCALGLKVGTLLNAHTRYKTLVNSAGSLLNDYVYKEASKRFFNTTRIAGTLRVGYGPLSVFATYQITQLFKEGVAAKINPFSAGLTISGL